MAKFVLMMAFAAVLTACNNNSSSDGADVEYNPDSPATQYRGVENVNGNIPDSTSYGSEPMSNSADTTD